MSALVNKFRNLKPAHFFTTALVAVACAAPAQDLPSDDGDDTPTVHAGTGSGGSPASSAGTSALPTAGTSVVGSGGSATAPKGGAPGSSGTATAGGTAASTGGSVAATAGTASSCPQYAGALAKDSAIFVSGFGTATTGTWKGYGFTYKYGTATIAPGAGTGCFAAKKFCANGSVPADDKSGAGLGWNISQVMNASTTTTVAIATPVVLKFAGVTAGMRAQLSASATVSYCYTFTAADAAGTATIPLASFKTECWGTTGVAYDGVVPIEAIQIAVPGSTAGAVQPFDICVLDVEPG